MIRKLNSYGNSKSLTINKTMQEHLGTSTEVEVEFVQGGLFIRKPDSEAFQKAKEFGMKFSKEHGWLMSELAK